MPFLPNRLWRRRRWAVGGGIASLISSPGGLISGCTPGHSLWSPDIISIPHFHSHRLAFLTLKADGYVPGYPYRLLGPADERPVRWDQQDPPGQDIPSASLVQQMKGQ